MQVEPQAEHHWLQKLVGEWVAEAECSMGPGQPPSKTEGTESVRSIGGIWVMAEGRSQMPDDGGIGTTIMTLGYDPARKRFVGSFLGSMMTHLWVYDGALDASGTVLTLDTEGPSFTAEGKMAKYQDIISFQGDDRRLLTSRVLGEDGAWHEIVRAQYRRRG